MAKRLLEGPVVFRSPFWDGEIKIETINDYCAWARFAYRIDNKRGAELRALEIWAEERDRTKIDSCLDVLEWMKIE